MKTILFILVLVIEITFTCSSQVNQSCTNLHAVYDSYRSRLRNDFLVGIGPSEGMSIPAENRDERQTQKKLRWGDGTIQLAEYIMVLATEYTLFTREGKNTDQTIMELYWALYAFDRLDYTAETYYGGTAEMNGFFMRDDIETVTVPGAYLDHVNNGDPNHPIISSFTSDYNHAFYGNYDNEEGKDQIIQLLVAMALVKYCLPPGLTYKINGVDQTFLQSANTSLHEEAKNIVYRILTYVHPLSQTDWDAGAWSIFNAADNHEVPNGRGGKMLYESYGYKEVLQYMTGEDMTANIGTYAWFITWSNWFKDWVNLLDNFASADIDKYCMLATVINPWNDFFESDRNFTARKISDLNNPNQYHYASLIHNFLNPGKYINDFTKTEIETRLNTAPYGPPHYGPWYYSVSDHAGYYWSTTSGILHPDRFGGSPNFEGEYNGLDFMLLHNLYYLVSCCPDPLLFQNKTYTSYKNPYQAAYRIDAGNLVDPAIFPGPVTVVSGGDIAFLAGREINLLDGFSVDPGGEFSASIENCCNNDFPDGYTVSPPIYFITPDFDGYNDRLCIEAPLASRYEISVWRVPYGTKVYSGSGIISESPACVWDGTGASYTGTYNYIVSFSGCLYQNEANGSVYVNIPNGNKQGDSSTVEGVSQNELSMIPLIEQPNEEDISKLGKVFSCFPVPASNSITLVCNPANTKSFEIFTVQGISVFRLDGPIQNSTIVDVRIYPAGLYIGRIVFQDGTSAFKKIVIKR